MDSANISAKCEIAASRLGGQQRLLDRAQRGVIGPKHPVGYRRHGLARPRGWSNCRLFLIRDHRLGPGDVSFEAERFRHRAIATHQVPIDGIVAAGPG